MGALGIKRNRSIDSLWEVNEKTIMALESTLGVVIGSDDGRVLYIQDTGVKEVGRGYIDRATKKVHICKERTEDVINTSTKFADHSIQSIYNKLENLQKIDSFSTVLFGDTNNNTLNVRFNKIGNVVSVDTAYSSAPGFILTGMKTYNAIVPIGFRPISGAATFYFGNGSKSDYFIKIDNDNIVVIGSGENLSNLMEGSTTYLSF